MGVQHHVTLSVNLGTSVLAASENCTFVRREQVRAGARWPATFRVTEDKLERVFTDRLVNAAGNSERVLTLLL